ncbi:3-hydroxyacyl-[acyl-carrier-protein] dehydratase FabZ [Arenibacter antarcticus]|uniref:3-hydroxymyristoyl/3-hydroxydecanoyl-(Acyl carrier protein) dehydratase n=1 Tax=Arenibacter antarcticus TaxID=2040469 RepID=A0ABW5VLD9_9FLAO|nr:hypothetical protein [Arenibacter sp. H213]MCM4169038.1 hypothetical protein [Arenibacter sp. H213]
MNLLNKTIQEKSVIENLIPQKYPFIMVDKLHHYSETQVITGLKVLATNIFVKHGAFMAAGLIEHMAQSVALHTGYQFFLKNEAAPTGYIGAIKMANILELPKIDQELTTTATILHEILGVTLVQVQVECNGAIIATSELKTVLAN